MKLDLASPELRAQFVEKFADMTAALPKARTGFLAPGDPALWAEQWAAETLIAAREACSSLRITGPKGNDFKVNWEGKPAYDARCKPVANARLATAVRNFAALIMITDRAAHSR